MNLIVISINVDINKKRDEILFKKPSSTEMKDLLTDQLFFKFSAAIPAEILSTSDSLAVRIALAKSVSVILCCSSCRAVKTVFKNIDLSVSVNLILQTVRIALSANSTSATSDSDSQAVKIILPAHRSCSCSQKNEVALIVQQVQKLI